MDFQYRFSCVYDHLRSISPLTLPQSYSRCISPCQCRSPPLCLQLPRHPKTDRPRCVPCPRVGGHRLIPPSVTGRIPSFLRKRRVCYRSRYTLLTWTHHVTQPHTRLKCLASRVPPCHTPFQNN